jgi:hypothetical protein
MLSWQHLNASLRSVLAIPEYFMLIQCLENIGEGLLRACISSIGINWSKLKYNLTATRIELANCSVPSALDLNYRS